MHPRIQEVLSHLDIHRAALKAAVASIPATLHARRPAADQWSVSEILEHLTLVEGRIGQLLIGQIHGAVAAGLEPEQATDPVVPTLDDARVTDRSRPIVASEASTPTKGATTSDSWALLEERRRAMRDAVISVDGLALGTVQIPHPRLGVINLYQWLVFLGSHEARHAEQIREVGAALSGAAR